MFNGYHEPPGTAYNDLEVDRGKKKWPCGNGTNIQSTHMHPQNHQSEIWCSKSPYIGLPNSVNTGPKCNCPSCYQLPENQSYQGDITWHRSWLSRSYPAPVSQDLVKFQANHHWENTCLPAEAYGENAGAHYVQESADKPLFYKSYSELRHAELYQPAVISSLKTPKIARKEDFPNQDENELGHQTRFSSSIPNPGCGSFRNAMERRRIEEESVYSNQNGKYLNMESSRQQRTPGPYHLHPNRRGMLESFSKTVPSTTNQNRVPSVGHHNIKDNVFHSYIDQSNIGMISSYNANQAVTKDKHCRSLYQPDVTKELNPGQENLRTGLLNTFSPAPVDYHSISFNRDFQNTLDFQKYMNSRNPQYLPRNNICDVIFRNCQNFVVDTRKDYSASRKGVINTNMSNPRAALAPPKYMDVGLPKSPTYGKLNSRDCGVSGRVSTDVKLVLNPNGKESFEGFQKADDIIHSHFSRTHSEGGDSFATEKGYNPLPLQNPVYKGSRRPEHSYRDIQVPYDQPNGMMNLKNNTSMGLNQEQIPNFADIHTRLEAYNRVNNSLPYDGSCQQFEKLHDQIPSENKVQASAFVGHQTPPNFFEEPKKVRQSEKEDSAKISHLESIRYEELWKNGTSKISPLRLLRKKKFTQPKKEDAVDAPTQDVGNNSKNATSPLDVRRFWATWAEEEEDNVPQTQMVVLDCHNIDPEEAGLLHLYNPEPIRTIQLDESSLLDVKSSQYDAQCEQNLAPFKMLNFDNGSGEKTSDGSKTDVEDEKFKDEARKLLEETKYLSGPDLSFGMTLVMDSAKEAVINPPDTKLNAAGSQGTESNDKIQTFKEDVKQFDIFKYCDKNSEPALDANETTEHVMSCEDGEITSVLIRDDLVAAVPNENNVKETVTDDFESESQIREEETGPKTKELSTFSDSSDDSQTGDISTLSNLPTSEYRKNKFLDYTGDSFCNGSFSLKGMNPQNPSKEAVGDEKTKDENEVEKKLENLTAMSKSSEVGPNDFEIDEILKKLSDINVQSPDITGKGVELTSDVPEKSKTDKKIIDRKEKKTKKLSHKSSRAHQLALRNVSPSKSKVKFSIQKSHDLKISLKVLNNSIKSEEHDSNETYNEVTERVASYGGAEGGETTEEQKKNEGELIPLKMKSLDEESFKSKEDEDEARKCKKVLKKKKIRLDRSPSPKTPVLKIKKNRYMLNGSEKEGNADTLSPEHSPKISESDGQSHGDFQVHETVDSAKIKLTFKRNKNGNGKKNSSPEVDEMPDIKSEDVCSEYSLDTDLTLGGGTSSNDNSNEALVSHMQGGKDKASVIQCKVDDMEYLNQSKPHSNDEELGDESSKIENESLNLAVDSSEMPTQSYDSFLNESEKDDSQLSLPVINLFGCDSVERKENQKDYLLNNSANQIAENNVLDNEDLPDYQDAIIGVDEGECINCDKAVAVGQDKKNKFENRPSEGFEREKDGVTENKENTSKLDLGIKVELTGSQRDMECDTDEKYATDDIDMEVSFINSIEKLANDSLLKSETEVDGINDAKSPFTAKNCIENSFADAFEKGNFGSVKDTTANEPEHVDYKTIIGGDIMEVDTKGMWQDLDDTTVECCEAKKKVISDISDPLKELSEQKIADDLLSIDFPVDQSEKDIEFPISIEDSIVAGSPKQERIEKFSNFETGTENMFEIFDMHGEDEKRPTSENDLDINNSRAIDDRIIERRTEGEVVSVKSNRGNILDMGHANKAPIQQEFSIVPVGISHVSQYMQVTDDNNNNNSSGSTNNSNNNTNSNQRRLQKENAFLTRTVSRRCSCEDRNKEQKQSTGRLRCRSKSLNINITCPECYNKVETEVTESVLKVPVLDIPVSEIPLPPGDAPPGNCFSLEGYFKSKFLNNGKDGNSESGGEGSSSRGGVASCVKKSEVEISTSEPKHKLPFLLQSQCPEDLLPEGFEEFSISVESPVPKESNEHKFFEAFKTNNLEQSDVSVKGIREKEEETRDLLSEIVSIGKSSETEHERTPEIPEDFCGIKLLHDCPEYPGHDNVTICTRDVDLGLGESSFRAGGLYECDGLTFDEGLAIADDMEEEKVSDDDKFRNIMQNCLDNAKKFLSEGNLKLFPRDDFLEIDCFEDNTQDKKQDHISKDVLLASCEKSCSDELVLIDHQFSDISADFIPSFCSDAGSNLCPEILPVDNWPYLEEEVTSSPTKNKHEDTDLLSTCIADNFRLETSPLNHWNLFNDTDSEYVDQRLKNKSRAVSVCVTEGPGLLKTTEKSVVQRRRTIEGIGRWKSFHNSNEELTKSEVIPPTDLADEKYLLSPKKGLSSENARHSKSRDISHEKVKKSERDNTERSGKTLASTKEIRLEKSKPKSATNSIDFKSSLWQPKVVLFRISKKMIKDLSTMPKRSADCDSSLKAQTEENKKVKNKNDHVQKRESDDLNRSSKSNKSARNDREHSVHKTPKSEYHSSVDRIQETLTEDTKKKPRSEKLSEDSVNGGVKRKKNRFRNLYTKKRIVPDTVDITKDKSARGNSSSLVDSEEFSPERDLPKQAAFSQCKSTRSVSATKSDELPKKADTCMHHSKPKTEEEDEATKAKRKYKEQTHRQKSSEIDSSRHSYKSRDNKRKRENYESEHDMGSQRKKERNHARENEKTGNGEAGGRKFSECVSDEKSKKAESTSDREHNSKSKDKSSKHKYWKCEVCGFSKSSERAVHIQSHPFHCQSCHLAFKAEANFLDHLTRKHKDIRNQHHCLLCELSFDLEKDYYRHLETREHRHLETVEKNTINTLFTLLTGHPCPVLGHFESKPEWLPTQAGTVHFYHQATPLSLALQYLKLHRDKTSTLSTQIE